MKTFTLLLVFWDTQYTSATYDPITQYQYLLLSNCKVNFFSYEWKTSVRLTLLNIKISDSTMLLQMFLPSVLFPFISWWTPRLISFLEYWKYCCNEHRGADFISLGYIPSSETDGSYVVLFLITWVIYIFLIMAVLITFLLTV
jgi:hypothetical protein